MRLQSSLGDVISPALGGHSDNLTGSHRTTDCHNSQELLITISSLRGWLNGLVLDSVEVPPACPLAASACWEGPLEQDNMLRLIILFSFLCVLCVYSLIPWHTTHYTLHYYSDYTALQDIFQTTAGVNRCFILAVSLRLWHQSEVSVRSKQCLASFLCEKSRDWVENLLLNRKTKFEILLLLVTVGPFCQTWKR